MPFKFLTYLQPTNYFRLEQFGCHSIFPDANYLPQEVLKVLEPTTVYSSNLAKQYDLSWQAIMLGYTGDAHKLTALEPVSLKDNYRFIARYFALPWRIYTLFLRLVTFHNPVKELAAFFGTLKVKRVRLTEVVDQPPHDLSLVVDLPLVSVVIPTLNRYDYLFDVLKDLENQDYNNMEILIIDQSDNYKPSFYNSFKLNLQVIRQEEKALWLARNTAIKKAKGDYLLLFDDDSRVDSDWVSSHLAALDYFKADISSGVSISQVGAQVPAHYSYYRISDQLDTGNVMIKRGVFKQIGLFDRQFERQRMGDGEFGLRAYLAGLRNISNPKAKRLHLKVGSGGLRDMGSWDAFRPSKFFAPRPLPSVLYFYRRYFGDRQAKYALWRTVPLSIMPYRFKSNKVLQLLGAVLSILLLPLVLIQVLKSWQLSSKKLKQGPLIEILK